MPYLNARISGPASAERIERVAGILADVTAEELKKKRELTSIAVECLSPSHWFVGGPSIAEQGVATFFLEIRTTEGTNTKDEKARFISRVFIEMEAILGLLHAASYVVIQEVRADAWGYGGDTQESRYIRGKAL
jgi:4-oxalocrotonate tautomerase